MKCNFSCTDPLQTKKVRKVPPGLPSSVSTTFFTCSDKNWAQIAFSLPATHTNYLPLALGGLSAGHEQLGWVIGSGSAGLNAHLMWNF